MAELLLKVGASGRYEDGDCICAFSDNTISYVHAQRICHSRDVARNSDGLIPVASMPYRLLLIVSRYWFRRVSKSEVIRTTLGGPAESFSNQPHPETGEYINVNEYLKRRRRKPIFGVAGQEEWFGGHVDFSPTRLSSVWDAIETHTSSRRTDAEFQKWPMGVQDVKSHLAVQLTADLSADEEYDTTAQEVRIINSDSGLEIARGLRGRVHPAGTYEEVETIRERAHMVDWRTSLELSNREIKDILKKTLTTDRRDLSISLTARLRK